MKLNFEFPQLNLTTWLDLPSSTPTISQFLLPLLCFASVPEILTPPVNRVYNYHRKSWLIHANRRAWNPLKLRCITNKAQNSQHWPGSKLIIKPQGVEEEEET